MTKQDTGGPAKDETLLDKRAGEAMQTVLQSHFKNSDEPNFDNVARWAYVQAEAMIAEKRRREK